MLLPTESCTRFYTTFIFQLFNCRINSNKRRIIKLHALLLIDQKQRFLRQILTCSTFCTKSVCVCVTFNTAAVWTSLIDWNDFGRLWFLSYPAESWCIIQPLLLRGGMKVEHPFTPIRPRSDPIEAPLPNFRTNSAGEARLCSALREPLLDVLWRIPLSH